MTIAELRENSSGTTENQGRLESAPTMHNGRRNAQLTTQNCYKTGPASDFSGLKPRHGFQLHIVFWRRT